MARSRLFLAAFFLVPSLAVAAVGTWFVRARSLEAAIGYDPLVIFLALFVGSAVGIAVVYYAFRLDVEAAG